MQDANKGGVSYGRGLVLLARISREVVGGAAWRGRAARVLDEGGVGYDGLVWAGRGAPAPGPVPIPARRRDAPGARPMGACVRCAGSSGLRPALSMRGACGTALRVGAGLSGGYPLVGIVSHWGRISAPSLCACLFPLDTCYFHKERPWCALCLLQCPVVHFIPLSDYKPAHARA